MRDNKEFQRDDFTAYEVFVFIKDLGKILLEKKWQIIIGGIIGGILFGVIEFVKPNNYTAELTFIVNEDEGGNLGGASAVLGQFGLGNLSNSDFNLNKILELSKSNKIAGKVLFDSTYISSGNPDLIINQIIDLYDLDKNLDTDLIDSITFKESIVDENSMFKKKIYKKAYKKLTGVDSKDKPLFTPSFDEETAILKFKVKSFSEELSIDICNSIFKHLSKFYIEQTIEKNRTTLEVLNNKSDSIFIELKSTELELAKLIDNQNNVLLRSPKIKELELTRSIKILSISYGELIKNIETTEFLIETIRPFFQLVDNPSAPLKKTQRHYFKQIFVGSLLFIFVVAVFYFLKDKYRYYNQLYNSK